MNPNIFTENSILAINDSRDLAIKYKQSSIKPEILALALLLNKEGLIPRVIEKMNLNVSSIISGLEREIEKFPKIEGNGLGDVSIDSAANRVLIDAEEEMKKMGDSYVSVEHLMLAIIEIEKSGMVYDILRSYNITEDRFMEVLREVRGSQRVDTQDPEGTYDALAKYGTNLNELVKSHKLDPVIGRDEEIRRTVRILSRRTKNNPVLIGEPGVLL